MPNQTMLTQPQRVGLMSFDALSQRDHLTKLFEKVTSNASKYNVSATVDGTNYSISGFQPGFFYNDFSEKNESCAGLMKAAQKLL